MSSSLSTGLWVESGTLSTPPHLSLDPAGLSSDSGLGGSSDGSSDVLAFGAGSVVDSVTEEGGCTPPRLPAAQPRPPTTPLWAPSCGSS